MKETQNDDKPFNVSFNIKKRNKNINYEIEDNRIRSVSLNNNSLKKLKPKLKPINANINPSPIKLTEKENTNINDESFSIKSNKKQSKNVLVFKINDLEIEEEIYEKTINSNDEEYSSRKLPHVLTDSSDNDSRDNDYINKKKIKSRKGSGINAPIPKKKVNWCIQHTRRKMDKIKNNIQLKSYKDDSILNSSYKTYLSDNYRIKCAQNYINKLKLESLNEYDKIKNKTISFKDIKNCKPPILGFLQMNEQSINSTLSSCNLSEI